MGIGAEITLLCGNVQKRLILWFNLPKLHYESSSEARQGVSNMAQVMVATKWQFVLSYRTALV
ncbi:MAG: hypothetical protein ABI575_06415 [Oxalobacteraceae bacterium]